MPNGFLSNEDMKKIVENGDMQLVVQKAKDAAKHIAEKLKVSSNQLRNIFNAIKKIQLKVNSGKIINLQRQLLILIPKLYYISKRTNGKLEKLKNDIEGMVELIDNNKDKFNNFYSYIEALLAYHRAFEKDKKKGE